MGHGVFLMMGQRTGMFFYGLSAPGDLLWLLGLPAGKVGVTADMPWRLYEQASGRTLAQGTFTGCYPFSQTGPDCPPRSRPPARHA